jgi:hypothetical protein
MTDAAQRARIRRRVCAEHRKLGTISSEIDVHDNDVFDGE